MQTRVWTLLFTAIPGIAFTLTSCSSGPSGPQAGTPEWYWQAANEAYTLGDIEKAQEHLAEVASSDSENMQQAVLWRAMLTAGLARGYMELGNTLAEAVEDDESLAGGFIVRIQDYRRSARRHAISFTESMGTLRKVAEQQPAVSLQFPFPSGTANEAPALISLRAGEKIPPQQIDAAVGYTLQRGLLFQAAEMAGADEDVAKAQGTFTSGSVEVPRLIFLQSLGKSLFDVSALFTNRQLNEPNIRKVMLDSALQCLQPSLESEDKEAQQQAEQIKKSIEKEAKS
jgi:hypothetical protein